MLKRIADILISSLLLLLLSPLLLIVFLLVRCMLGSPGIFCQMRLGLNCKPFTLYKFRTMTIERDFDGQLLPDENRISRFGSFLRSSSLDELPELWSVLKGEMSLVGPRPLLMEYLPIYSTEQIRRHEVRPGITGWAQVNGRNSLDWEEKFKLDTWYVDNMNFGLDMKIIFLTVIKVIMQDGINAPASCTPSKFKRTNEE